MPQRSNCSMPVSVAIPVLAYRDVREAVVSLGRAFGFTERLRIGVHRSQLEFSGAAVVGTGGGGLAADTTHSIMVRIDDADAMHARALRAGAEVFGAPTDFPYGERQFSVRDQADTSGRSRKPSPMWIPFPGAGELFAASAE